MLFLPQSLIILIDLRLLYSLSQRTTSVGTITFHLRTYNCKGAAVSSIS